MKRILIFILILVSFKAVSQTPPGSIKLNSKVHYIIVGADSAMYPPLRDTTWTPGRLGALTVRPADGFTYSYISASGKKWDRVGGLLFGKDDALLGQNRGVSGSGQYMFTIDSSIFLVKGEFGTGMTLPAVGTGSRMFYYPKKAAFRTGYASYGLGDIVIGDYSSAFGFFNTASGSSSFAAGASNTVSGGGAFAAGNMNLASGLHSIAIGNGDSVLSNGAGAFGNFISTSGTFAYGFGTTHNIMGDNSVAFGTSNIIRYSGINSFVAGSALIQKNPFGAMFGQWNDTVGAGNRMFVIANGWNNVQRRNIFVVDSNALVTTLNGATKDTLATRAYARGNGGGGGGGGSTDTTKIFTRYPLYPFNDSTFAVRQFTPTDSGIVAPSGGGTANFLRADGAWAAPPGGAGADSATFATKFTVLSKIDSAGTLNKTCPTYLDTIQTTQLKNGATLDHYWAFPSVTKTPTGRLLLGLNDRRSHSDSGAAVVRYSTAITPLGVTWSADTLIESNRTENYTNPYTGVMGKNGDTILMTYSRDGSNQGTFWRYSIDNGRNWPATGAGSRQRFTPGDSIITAGKPVYFKGYWVVPVYVYPTLKSGILWSNNQGATWNKVYFAQGVTGNLQLNESGLVTTPDSIIVYVRSDIVGSDTLYRAASANVTTWTVPTATIVPGWWHGRPGVERMNDGRILLNYRYRDPVPVGNPDYSKVAISSDGINFTPVYTQQVLPWMYGDFAYLGGSTFIGVHSDEIFGNPAQASIFQDFYKIPSCEVLMAGKEIEKLGDPLWKLGTGSNPTWGTIGGTLTSQSDLNTALGTKWDRSGNAGTSPSIDFIGTTDDQSLRIKINNVNAGLLTRLAQNTFIGFEAGTSVGSGLSNTAFGYHAFYTGSGSNNTALGNLALPLATSAATLNTAVGSLSMQSNGAGSENTAVGYFSLHSNTSGETNTAVGNNALGSLTTGTRNVGYGYYAGKNLTTGSWNTAICWYCDFPDPAGDFQLNIRNGIYGINMDGYNNTISAGKIGIFKQVPTTKLDVEGDIQASVKSGYLYNINGSLSGNNWPTVSWTDSTRTAAIATALTPYQTLANLSNNTALGTSTTLYPTQNAAKAYVDALVTGAFIDQGNYNASTNLFPGMGGIQKGWLWTISVAGTLGGTAVNPGDVIRALVNTPGQTAGNWAIQPAAPLDADLVAIGALTPTNDDIIQRKAGAWTNRTVAQYRTDLGISDANIITSNVTTNNATTLKHGFLPILSGVTTDVLKGDGTWGSGAGEANTASNLGGGLANFSTKSGVDLRFNSFDANYFDLNSNLISLDTLNGAISGYNHVGFLSKADWSTFNGKVDKNLSNTYGAGFKQIFTSSATTAGINFVPIASDPSVLSNGDMWVNSSTGFLKAYLSGSAREMVCADCSETLTNKTIAIASNTLTGVAPLASPTFTGTVTLPTPFTIGATSMNSTGTQLNYLNAATGTTGTASTNVVFSGTPTIVTPSFTTGFTIGGAAAAGKIPIGNGTNYVASTPTYPNTTGLLGQYLQSDGTNVTWGFGVGQSAIIANSAALNTTETVVVNTAALPANRLQQATTFRVTLIGTCTSTAANVSTFAIRIGTNGTTADGLMQSAATTVAATTGTNIPFKAVFEFTVRTVGASATSHGYLTLLNTGVTGISAQTTQIILPTFTNFNTTTANLIVSATYKSAATTTTCTFNDAWIEIVHK